MEVRKNNEIDLLFWKIALKDDEEAFQTLFLEFFSPLCVFARRYVTDRETGEDIVQDTFFKIWKNRKKLQINTSGKNFLITSVRNACLDYLRKKEQEKQWQQQEMFESTAFSTDDFYSVTELENALNSALSRLPEKSRLVFEQNRFEGKTYAKIAEEQGLSVKTIEAYMTKALKQLRIYLKDFLPLSILFL